MTTDIDYSGTVPTDVSTGQTPVPQQGDRWLTRDEAKVLIKLISAHRQMLTCLGMATLPMMSAANAKIWFACVDRGARAIADLGPLWDETFKD